MTENKLLTRLLRMKGFRATSWFVPVDTALIRVGVKPHKNGRLCPHCGRRGMIVNRLKNAREWEDVPVCGRRVVFLCAL